MKKIFFTFLLLVSTSSFASPGNPDSFCRNGTFPQENNFQMATIKGAAGTKINFIGDDDGCPSVNPTCGKKAYLIPGDKVLVSRAYQGYMCAWYTPANPKASETVGWLPQASLEIIPVKPATAQTFMGTWKYALNHLDVKTDASTGGLVIDGEGFWKGLGDNIHNGYLAGKFVTQGNAFTVPELEECQVKGFIVENYLVVADNNQCGGANVSFTGVYRK
ncbi:hypothetical protein K1X76_09605 [bacterium]|nr:hypothetical protein [bacterium]